MKDTMEIVGQIATASKLNEWKLIEHLINETKPNAFKAGMTEAANKCLSLAACSEETCCERCDQNRHCAKEVLSARDQKTTL